LLGKYASQPFNPDVANAFFLPEKTTGKTPPKTPQMILEVLKITPSLTGPEIANQIGKSDSAVKRAIRKLREDGKLERVGPAKGGHWKVLGEKE